MIMRLLLIFYFFSPFFCFAQDCSTSGSEVDRISGSRDGKYILAYCNSKGVTPYSKIFDAQTGALLHRYPTRQPVAALTALGFTAGTEEAGIRTNANFIYSEAQRVDFTMVNKAAQEKLYGKIEYDVFDRENKRWIFRLVLPSAGGERVYKGSVIQYYYDIDRQWGLITISEPRKSGYKATLYSIKKGAEPQKIYTGDFVPLNNLFIHPAGNIAITNSGQVIDLVKEKIIKKNIFAGQIVTTKFALASENGSTLAVGGVNGGMLLYDLQTYKMIARVEMAVCNNFEPRQVVPLADMKSFALLSSCSENHARIIRDGKDILLCDPQALADQDNYKERKENDRLNEIDRNKITPAKAAAAYQELLAFLRTSDRQFEPYAKKIISAGKDAWILYSTRDNARSILRQQKGAIDDYIKVYKTFTDAGQLQSLYVRLGQIGDAMANIPNN
jgi:hypothetical protein